MKKITSISVIFIFILGLLSCSSNIIKTDHDTQIDKRLVGTWKGAEKDKQLEGFQKSWIMQRNIDGTFSLDFTFTQNGETKSWTETGTWYIKNNLFYEYHNESGQTDTYQYTVLNENQVKFVSKNISTEMNTDSYEFIDTRIIENSTN